MFPTSLIARPPDEPITSSVPFVVNLRNTLRNADERVQTATKRAARVQRKYYDDKSGRPSSRKGSWSGCTGHSHPLNNGSKSFESYGLANGG